MANNTIKTRIKLCYDTIENWVANNTILLSGEVGIAYVSVDSDVQVMQVSKPALLFKVGDGTTAFNDLPYISAVAADVYAWAKSATKPTYTSSEVGADAAGTASQLVNEHNTSNTAHTDIRTLISNLQEQLDSLGNALQFIGAGPVADRPQTAENGDVYIATDEGNEYVWSNGAWEQFGAGDALTKAQGDAYYDAKGSAEAVNTQLSETIAEVQSSVADNTTSISDIVSGTTVVPNAQNAVSAQTAQTATSAGTATSATNVTSQIAGNAISNIFESDGVTVKNATSAQSATEDSEGNVISTTYATQSSLESVSETTDNALSVANSKYTKPSDGIPETDLSQDVQQKLNNPVVDITPNPSGEATQQLNTIEINGVVYEVSPNMIVDLGDVGEMAEQINIPVTSEQLAQLLDEKTLCVKFTAGGLELYLACTQRLTEAGGTAIYEYTTSQSSAIVRYWLLVQAQASTQAIFRVDGVNLPESIVVDLGNVGNLIGSPITLNITEEQGQALLSNTCFIAKLCIEGDAYFYLTSVNKNGDGGGNADYTSYIFGEDSSPYIAIYQLSIRNSALTQPEFSVQKINLTSSSTSIVDLGNVGELSELPATITITPEQCTQLLAADASIVRFTTGDVIMNLLRMLKHGDGGGTAFYTATMVQDGDIVSHTLLVHNSTPTQAQLVAESISIGGTTVVANPTASATSALKSLQVGETVYSVGTPVIDLGDVTLTEQSLGGISMSVADNITVSAEQATLAQADTPPIVKVKIEGDTYEFVRTQVASDVSDTYILFAATSDMGEGTKFYNLQITVSRTGGGASAMLLVWKYDILQGLNYAYEARGLTFVDGVATKTITEEEKAAFNEGGYNQIRFWDNSNTNEIYALYLSHSNRGASSIDSHKADFFGVVENASVTGEGGGLTAVVAYLDNNVLTFKQIAIGSGGGGSSVPTPTTADAGKYVVVNPDGTSYILVTPNAANAQVISEEAYAELLASGQVDANTVYLIEGTSDNTLTLTAATTSYDNTTSGLTATNVQSAIDELQENKQELLTLQSLATLLGLTEAQLNNLITFSKSITSATTGSTTISGTITADTFNTNQ